MFAVRFDPGALISKKRKLSDASSSDEAVDSDIEEKTTAGDKDSSAESSSTSSSESDDSDDDEEKVESEDEKMNGEEINQESKEDKMDIDYIEEPTAEADPDYNSKHSQIFTRFASVKTTVPKDSDSEESDEEDEVESRKLIPLPQPELPRDKRLSRTSNNNLDWLTTPMYVNTDLTKPFSEFDVSPQLIKNLKNDGFTDAFSVQISVLDLLLKDIKQNELSPDFNGDVLVNASTGSGKTLAYSIPIIQQLSKRIVPRLRAIILVPTKPLIQQVRTTMMSLSKGTNLNIVSLKNDISLKEEHEKLGRNVPDILISTPGRLVDHLTMGSISLTSLQFLVIDEADRLLNQSFQNWCNILIKEIENSTSHADDGNDISNYWRISVKKLIFSATLTTDAGKLSLLKFNKPRLIIVNNEKQLVNEMFTLPSLLKEYQLKLTTSKSSIKPLYLINLIMSRNLKQNILVFTKSNESTLRLSRLLQLICNKLGLNFKVGYINSSVSTLQRKKVLKHFSTGEIDILIATDLIARGIDILTITDVINYDLPISAREYVHRVGRTARAGNSGNAYNIIIGSGEKKWFSKIVREVNRNGQEVDEIEVEVEEGQKDRYKEALEVLEKEVFHKN